MPASVFCLFSITLAFFTKANDEQVLLSEADSVPFIQTLNEDEAFFKNGSELVITGDNESDEHQILIIRLDNKHSSDYSSRVNQEFTLSPGPFELTIPIFGLKTSGGQPLEQPYSKLFVFSADTWADIELGKIFIRHAETLPDNTLALDFGSSSSATFPGFESVGKDSSFVRGNVNERTRISGGSLVRDAITGLDSLKIPWPNGVWKLSLWTQDQGGWEYYPHFLSRQIIANGSTIVDEKYTVNQWINDVYLAGRKKEGGIDGDIWSLIGKRRGGFITKNIRITNEVLNIDFTGDYQARLLTALTLEPLDGTFAMNTEEKRRKRYLNQWPVSVAPYNPPKALSLEDTSQQIKSEDGAYLVAKGSILNLVFQIDSPVDDKAPVIVITPPEKSDGTQLDIDSRYGHWHYERPSPNATSLQLDDSYLRADMKNIRLSNKHPRRIHVQAKVPNETPVGVYSGTIQLFSHGEFRLLNYSVKVLPVILPKLKASVGLYLEPPPYYEWFKLLSEQTVSTSCDFSLLTSHGFNTVAPALVTPGNEIQRNRFLQQIKQVKQAGFEGKLIAYSPLKRLLGQKSEARVLEDLKQLNQLLMKHDLPEIYWSIFDEPAKEDFAKINKAAKLLQDKALGFKNVGHINNKGQYELSEITDLLLINNGIDISKDSIEQFKEQSVVWLYNMSTPRIAAGTYLWRSEAEGYLQWHGRMPTANPFDPTDGREGDVILIYPSESRCPNIVDINRRFLDLHEATLDLRWLQWLENKSDTSPRAVDLLSEIRSSIPVDWEDASQLTEASLLEIRRKVFELILD